MVTPEQDPLAAALGEQLASQMQEQEAIDADFRQKQNEAYAGVNAVRDSLVDAFLNKHKPKGPQYPPEIIEIANALLSQPRLIAPTQQFLRNLVARINAAVDAAVNESLGTSTNDPS